MSVAVAQVIARYFPTAYGSVSVIATEGMFAYHSHGTRQARSGPGRALAYAQAWGSLGRTLSGYPLAD